MPINTDPLDRQAVRLNGFIQMGFDESWTEYQGYLTSMTDPWLYDLGIAMSQDVYDYSAAKPWSGRIVPGLTFDTDGDGPNLAEPNVGNGDVSWSPKFAFRSRFFSVFVLGQGMVGVGTDTTTLAEEYAKLRPQGEKRIEAVYDALLDQIIWQRSPVTDKRAMGEPIPEP
jgi:hypothetical protein